MDRPAAVIYDCEFLTAEGAMRRNWCGPHDPDPLLAQIGAVRLGLDDDFPVLDTLRVFVAPLDRFGAPCSLDPYFTDLTGITSETLAAEGLPLTEALHRFASFVHEAPMWAWGKDELTAIGISCFVAGIAPPFPANRFGNAARLLLKTGMPPDAVTTTQSNKLADWHGIEVPGRRAHDALDDALSVAHTLRHHLRTGALTPEDLLDTATQPD